MNSNRIFIVAIILSILIHAGIIAVIKFKNDDEQEDVNKGDPVEIEILPKEKVKEPPKPSYDKDIESEDESESTLEHDLHKGESKGQADGVENIIVGNVPEQKKKTTKDKQLLDKNEESKKPKLHDNILMPKSDNFEKMDRAENQNDSSKNEDSNIDDENILEEYLGKEINLSDYKNILNKYASVENKEMPKGVDSATFSAFEAKYESYFSKLRRKIYQIWQYPYDSIRRGEQGVMKVSFSILKDGSIVNIRVLESTGYSSLDREVMRILKNLGKTPLPKSYELEELHINEAYFIYTNNNRFLE